MNRQGSTLLLLIPGFPANEADTTCLPAQQFLHTTMEPRTIDVTGYRFRLDSLTPYPKSGSATGQGDYVAYLTITQIVGTDKAP